MNASLLPTTALLLVISSTLAAIPREWETKISSSNALYSPDDDGVINKEGYPEIYLPLIGNGYISHSKGVRSDTYFISGVFNNETTSPSHRARIPATFAVQVTNSETTGTLLDLLEGTYTRRGNLADDLGWYELTWYAHMSYKHLYVMELDAYLAVDVHNATLLLKNNAGSSSADIDFKYSERIIDDVTVSVECGSTTIPETSDGSTTAVCLAYTKVPSELLVTRPGDSTEVPTRTFLTAAVTSLDLPSTSSTQGVAPNGSTRTDLVADKCVREFMAAVRTASLRADHVEAWAELWKSGVEVFSSTPSGGETAARQDVSIAINASFFAIMSSIRDDWPYGLAPGGLTNYYNGHSFWDTETWMYPPMLMMHPTIGQSLLQYRYDRLSGAYAKALTYDPPYAGAMFPWESAFSGVETCPLFADTGLREQHISADISLAVWQYWSVTHDTQWLESTGFPILIGVADFLVSKAEFDDAHLAHIRDVIPPDEYVDHVNDSVYTNYAAKCALKYVVSAADILQAELINRETYTALADALVVLVDGNLGIHPEYENYNGSLVKQADVVLLHYPWNMDMSVDMQKADLEYYSTRTDENGPAMTWGMHAIGYKDLNMLDDAAVFFNHSFQLNMQPPFMVWTETPSGNAGNFITGAGGFLHTVVFGYPGLRIDSDQLLISSPTCIEGTTGSKLRGVGYLGATLDISYQCHLSSSDSKPYELTVTITAAGAIPLELAMIDYSTGIVTDIIPLKEIGDTVMVDLSNEVDVALFAIRASVYV